MQNVPNTNRDPTARDPTVGFAYAKPSELRAAQQAKTTRTDKTAREGVGTTAHPPHLPTGQIRNPSPLARANITPVKVNQTQPTSHPLPATQTKNGPPPLPTQTKKGSPQSQMLTQEQIQEKSSQLKQEVNLLYNYPFSRTPSQNEVELANSRQKRIGEIKIQLSELELQKNLIESRNELKSFQTTISKIIIPTAQKKGTEDQTRKDINKQVDAMKKEIQTFETQIQDLHKTYQHLFPIKKI